jgi:hypothetical protein
MAIDVYTCRIGDKYGFDYEINLIEKIDRVHVIHSEKNGLKLQWNKLNFFNLDIDEPIVVLDIDIDLINKYEDILNYPIERGQFLSMRSWWEDSSDCELNGGFYKFYPSDTKYIYEKFMSNKEYYENFWIELGSKPGPVNGEENFVEWMVKKELDLKFVPDTWVGRMVEKPTKEWLAQANRKYPGSYFYLDQINPDVKLLHYTM